MQVQPAPDLTLEHVEGHPVALSQYRGRWVVVAMGGRDSADQMGAAIDTLRRHYDAQQLPIFSVIDMSGIPRAARPMAKRKLKGRYQENVAESTAQLQAAGKPVPPAAELVITLPDWDGVAASSFGFTDVDREAAMVLVDSDGNIRGYGRGHQAAEQIMALFG